MNEAGGQNDTGEGFLRLVTASEAAEAEYVSGGTDAWLGSPFEWIKKIPSSRTRGAQAERLVARWLTNAGFTVASTGDAQADLLVDGRRVEVKMSTLWANSRKYKFQQIRDQDYDFAICLGLSPSEAHAYVLSKALLMDEVIGQGYGQHGGASAAETSWIEVDVDAPLHWLRPQDGNPDEALMLVREAVWG